MTLLRRGEYHAFEADGAPYVYLVPSAAVFKLDDASTAVLDALGERDVEPNELVRGLSDRFPVADLRASVEDLLNARAVRLVEQPVEVPVASPPRKRIPLTTLVLNVTSKCNLSCTYCYEYGEDRIVEASRKPRFMNEETARQSVEFMFADFMPTAADQIVNQLPKYRFMSAGQLSVPVTIRSICGAGGRFGTQHSATGESWYMALPGLHVVTAGSPGAAYRLLRAAIREPDPVLFFEHKASYRRWRTRRSPPRSGRWGARGGTCWSRTTGAARRGGRGASRTRSTG